MKKIFIAIALILSWNVVVAQNTLSVYKVLQGKIGSTDATLHIYLAGNKAGGYLWISSNPRPMPCYANFNKTKDSLNISAHANTVSITLKGKLTSSELTGVSVIEKENNGGGTASNNQKKSVFNLKLVTNGYTAFDFVYASGKELMPSQLKNESTAEYYAATVWPKPLPNKALEHAIKLYINREYNNKTGIKEPGKIFVAEKNKFLNDWKLQMNKTSMQEAKDRGISLSRQVVENINVMYEDAKVITLAHYSYEFTGGAHGNYSSNLQTFNKQTGAVVKLTDVLTQQGIDKLPQLLETAVREQYSLDSKKTLEQNGLFVNKMEPSDNFYIANNAVGFIYSTYELMSYAVGEPNIVIPPAAIGLYLKAPYKN